MPLGDPDQGFYLMEKVEVNGPSTHPVYSFLKGATPNSSDIKWNFASYWLISSAGAVQRLEGGRYSPASFLESVEAALA